MPSFAADAEPNDTIEDAEGGGLLSWPENPRYDLPLNVQSGDPGLYNGGDPHDPADWVEIALDAGAQTVIFRPFIDDDELTAQLDRPGVAGAFATAWFTPSGMFFGAPVILIAKIGDAAHDDLSQPGGAFHELDLLLALMREQQVQNNNDGIVDASLNADVDRTQGIIDLYRGLGEFDGVNRDSNAVAEIIQAAATGGSSGFSPQINALAAELAEAVSEWDVVHYYIQDIETTELTPVDPFFDLGPLSDGITWDVVSHPSNVGYIEVTGNISVSVWGGENLSFESYAVSTFGADIAYGTGAIPAAVVLTVDQDLYVTLDDSLAGAHAQMSFDASVLTSAHAFLLDATTVTVAAISVIGGAGDDALAGGAGADTFNGGAGVDIAGYLIDSADASFARSPSGAWTVTSAATGVDTLTGIEYLYFDDRTLALRSADGSLDGDTSDIVLRNATSGALATWQLAGATVTSASVVAITDPSYAAVASGDFNGDGRADVLFRNAAGILAEWQFNGAGVAGVGAWVTDPAWTLAGVGDFNGDHRDDILWRHEPTGLLAQWQMDGFDVPAVGVFAVSDTAWALAAIADFDGDGHDDFLWRHSSGALAQWSLDGFDAFNHGVFAISDTAWSIAGTGDFNGDLREDIMWRHSSGVMALWHMDGTTVTSVGTFAVSDTAWNVSDIGDYNGDGRDDILWQGPDGTFAVWAMNGFAVTSAGVIGNPGPGWGDI